MRLMIVNMLYPPTQFGGAEKAASLLAEAFVRRGDQVSAISLHTGQEEIAEHRNGVKVYRLPMDNLYWPFDLQQKHGVLAKTAWHMKDTWNKKAAGRVSRILDQEKPDIIHTHTLTGFSVSVWKEARKRRIGLVHTMHDYYLLCGRACIYRNNQSCPRQCLDCRALRRVQKRWSQKLDAIVSVSEYVLNTHRRCGYSVDVPGSVIYNIATSSVGKVPPQSPSPPPRVDELVFGFIGRVCHEKGIGVLLEATKHLAASGWCLRIAGEGSEEYVSDLQKKFTHSRIEWLGFTSSAEFYESIDVTIVPSIWQDPLPYVVIESLMAGKSIICAESGGLPELSRLAKTVKTYPATDVQALVSAMQGALSDKPTWRNGGFADPNSAALFTEDAVVAKYRAVYEDLKVSAQL